MRDFRDGNGFKICLSRHGCASSLEQITGYAPADGTGRIFNKAGFYLFGYVINAFAAICILYSLGVEYLYEYDTTMKAVNMKDESPAHIMTYDTMNQSEVPRSRNGKHRKVVSAILGDVEALFPGTALKVPLRALMDSKENLRSALSRESKKRKMAIATAADADFLYVWQIKGK